MPPLCGSVQRVRMVLIPLVVLALQPVAVSSQVIATAEDTSVVRAVLEARALPDLVKNWTITSEVAEVVVSDQLSGCTLPYGDAETKRVNAALERLAAGHKVAETELQYRAPSPDEDLVISPMHIVPAEIVQQCLLAGAARLPRFEVKSRVKTVFEDSDVIASEFRRNPRAWKLRHPRSIGVVTMGRPVYALDHSVAGVSYSRFREGVGGGIFFCLLKKRPTGWMIVWQETILIE